MNMREYWANEAAMMRDKSGVLGKEVLTANAPSQNTPKVVNEHGGINISLLSNELQKAVYQFMTTTNGWNFIGQFAKKDDKLKFDIGNKIPPFELTFDRNGARSNDILLLTSYPAAVSTNSYGLQKEGVTVIYEGKDYSYKRNIANADAQTDLSKGLTISIQLSETSANKVTNILAHEAFVHAQASLERISMMEISKALKPSSQLYITNARNTVAAKLDHQKLAKGEVQKYRIFSEQLDKLQNTDYYTKQYNNDVEYHKKSN